MAQQSSFYITDGVTRTYPSSKHIASKQHVAVYFQSVTTSTWSIVEPSQYEVVNNSVVFYTAPVETIYSQIEIRVADTTAELEDSPSDIAIVAGAITDVINLSNNINVVENVNNNMGAVTTVSANITNLNSIVDDVIPNLPEILLADDNATIATTKAIEASMSATLAQGYAESIIPSSLVKNIDTIADLATIDPTIVDTDNVFVKDLDRGGLFVWSSTGTANGGTVFAGLTGYWNRQYDGAVNVKWFENSVGIALANSSTKEVTIEDTIDIGATGVSVSEDINIKGVSLDAEIVKEGTTTALDYVFKTNDNDLVIKDLKISISDPTYIGNINNVFNMDSGTKVLENCKIDGGVEQSAITGLRTSYSNITTIGSSDNSGLTLRGNKFSNFAYGILKSNVNTSKQYDIDISFNSFDDFESPALLFNSPAENSLIENIQIIGNKLGSNISKVDTTGVGGYSHRGSFAGNTNYCRLIGNHATGDGRALFRSEEARAVIMSANTAKLNGKQGIDIIPNDAGGYGVNVPKFFVVSNNVLDHTETLTVPESQWGIGLHTYKADYFGPVLKSSSVHDNIVNNFDVGLKIGRGAELNAIHNNVIDSCEVGLEVTKASQTTKDTLIIDGTTAIDFKIGGILGDVHFRTKSLNVRTSPLAINIDEGQAILKKWTYEQFYNVPNLASYTIPIITLGSRIRGKLIASTYTTTNIYRVAEIDFIWDGATITQTNSFPAIGIGGVSFSSILIENQSGVLHLRCVNATGNTSTAYLQLSFEGIHVIQ